MIVYRPCSSTPPIVKSLLARLIRELMHTLGTSRALSEDPSLELVEEWRASRVNECRGSDRVRDVGCAAR